MKEYKIIQRATKSALQKEVEKLLQSGWRLVGGVDIVVMDNKTQYAQTLVK